MAVFTIIIFLLTKSCRRLWKKRVRFALWNLEFWLWLCSFGYNKFTSLSVSHQCISWLLLALKMSPHSTTALCQLHVFCPNAVKVILLFLICWKCFLVSSLQSNFILISQLVLVKPRVGDKGWGTGLMYAHQFLNSFFMFPEMKTHAAWLI